ncbi:tyrosine phosphatase family protein [Methylovirgula sp. 4M-Z18]|uniref:tyrosine phosphatase family protein n=1 Tax=Methylovirgula sp. 4M-Z18 TaxID=2293567 RepID=UPI000E2FC17A|nr:protein-tyrosine-phosphatase [Methylovirgula sp. 4M-Z18]RFB77987.1 protein-tyrosine-phosphatase [Methylovirgula sp. 4M-Z18]
MQPDGFSALTVCGVRELADHRARGVTHVLSLIDADWPEMQAFADYDDHHRVVLEFDDIIEPIAGKILPAQQHMEAILRFGETLKSVKFDRDGHLLVHCYMGVSRSTAAMVTLLTQALPDASEEHLFARLQHIRPQAWPNSHMISQADHMLGRGGRLTQELRRHYGRQLQREPNYRTWMRELGRESELAMAVTP